MLGTTISSPNDAEESAAKAANTKNFIYLLPCLQAATLVHPISKLYQEQSYNYQVYLQVQCLLSFVLDFDCRELSIIFVLNYSGDRANLVSGGKVY